MRRVPFYIEYFSIQGVLLHKSRAYSLQWVLTIYTMSTLTGLNTQQLLLHTMRTNSMQRVLTLYNEYSYIQLRVLIHTTITSTYNEYLLYATSKFHTASTYSMQRVLTLYNDCLLYATTTLCNTYLLMQWVLTLHDEYLYMQRVFTL